LTSDSGTQYEVEIPFLILNIRLLTMQNYLRNMAFKRVILPVLQNQVELRDFANMLYYDFFSGSNFLVFPKIFRIFNQLKSRLNCELRQLTSCYIAV
jgi:hypothetical protein